jgi:hypothetical protein
MTEEQIKARDKVKADLKKLGIDDPMFDDMDALVTNKVKNALGSDPMGKSPTTQKAALEWAARGAGGDPSEFANRYEYAKAKFSEASKAAVAAKAKNARADAEAATTPDKLADGLNKDIAKVKAFGPGDQLEPIAPGADPKDTAAAVKGLKRVAFQSDTAEAYHAVKHQGELPPEFRTGNAVDNYQNAYNDTIKTGNVVKAVATPTGSTQVIIQKTYAGTGAPMEAIIYVKPDGEVVLASYGAAKAK